MNLGARVRAIAERPRKPKKKCATMLVRRHVTQTLLGAPRHRRKIAFLTIQTFCSLPDWSERRLTSVVGLRTPPVIDEVRIHHRKRHGHGERTRTGNQEPDVLSSSRLVSQTPAVPNPHDPSTNFVVCASEDAMKNESTNNSDFEHGRSWTVIV